MKSAGYSGKPVSEKLGFKPGSEVLLISPPDNYADLVAPIPEGVSWVNEVSEDTSAAHIFVTSAEILSATLSGLRQQLRTSAFVWVSWPKRASKVATDITEDTIREIALPLGYVDVKVCAVSDVWSGLELFVRKELR